MIADVPPARFEELFAMVSVQAGRRPGPGLAPVLKNFHEALARSPTDPLILRTALTRLLEFLSSEETDENCETVSDFVMVENEWEMDWSYLPSHLEDLMFDLSRTHRHHDGDTGDSEQVTPARLLQRLQALPPQQ